MALARFTLPAHNVRDFTELPIPFACVVTDLETGEGVRLNRGSLSTVIRASIAIPTIFSPVKITFVSRSLQGPFDFQVSAGPVF